MLVAVCTIIGIFIPPMVTTFPEVEKFVPLIVILAPPFAFNGDTLTIVGITDNV